MNDIDRKVKKFFMDCGMKNLYVKCRNLGNHFYNVEIRTSSPITVDLVLYLLDKKFFNMKIIDATKTKMVLFLDIYEDDLVKL